MNKKISIFLSFKNRSLLLFKTLQYYEYYFAKRMFNDYEYLIFDDLSDNSEYEIIKQFNFRNIKIERNNNKKHGYNSVTAYNSIRKMASGDIFIITCAEVVPTNSKFLDIALSISDNEYVSGSCLAFGILPTLMFLTHPLEKVFVNDWIKYDTKWYEHSIILKRNLNFFSIISKTAFDKVSGFNENLINNKGGEDIDFINRLRLNDISINSNDDMCSFHLCHYLNGDEHYYGHISHTNYFNDHHRIRKEYSDIELKSFMEQ